MASPYDVSLKSRIVVRVPDRLKDRVAAFLADRRTDAAAVLDAVDRERFGEARRIGRRLKGAGGGYGFDVLPGLGGGIEAAAGRKDARQVRQGVQSLLTYLDRVEVVVADAATPPGAGRPLILSIDDDPDTLNLIRRFLEDEGFDVLTADRGHAAIAMLRSARPQLILLDVMMPGVDGYRLCSQLLENESVAGIPVVFVTGLGDDLSRARAFAAGAVDYLTKPIRREDLLRMVSRHLETHRQWEALSRGAAAAPHRSRRERFIAFKRLTIGHMESVPADVKARLNDASPADLYAAFAKAGVKPRSLARKLAIFTRLHYRGRVAPENIQLGVLPTSYCRENRVLAIRGVTYDGAFVVSNPFDEPLMDTLARFPGRKVLVTEPETIDKLTQC